MSVGGSTAGLLTLRAAERGDGLVLGMSAFGSTVVAVGGQGSDLFFFSENGRDFERGRSPGPGLRSVLLREDGMWVIGEYGYLARSTDLGKTWTRIATTTKTCCCGLAGDAGGRVWAGGDDGYLAVSADGVSFTQTAGIAESIERMSFSPTFGVLAATDAPGLLYACSADGIRKLGLNAGDNLMCAAVTRSGTVIVVGKGGAIFRSVDQGASFSKIETGTSAMLANVDAFEDGRVVAVGDFGTILVSIDDGASFQRVNHAITTGTIWCCKRYGTKMLLGGASGLILELS